MATKHVSPNRMELMRLKRELKTARRGHRMLKDKRDGLMKQFLLEIYEARDLRQQVDELLSDAASQMQIARAVMQPEYLGQALLQNHGNLEVEVNLRNIMAVQVPSFQLPEVVHETAPSLFPYSLVCSSAEMDEASRAYRSVAPYLIELAEREKTVQLLADEIEKTRRRVNSLEHVMIPQLESQIKLIGMKMDENERGNLTRLMKVKDLLIAQEIEKRRANEQ